MDREFNNLVQQLPELLRRLSDSPLKSRSNLSTIPSKGVYLFYENANPIYVGRTDRMKARLQEHSRPSSGHTSATFAFNIATKDAIGKGIDVKKPRKLLEQDRDFAPLFSIAKERVSRMGVRVVGIDDPIVQTLFEVYAVIALKTQEYNYFETH